MWAIYKQVIWHLDNCMSLISKFRNCVESIEKTYPYRIESIKTTSMEDVGTRVLEKNKEYLRRQNIQVE